MESLNVSGHFKNYGYKYSSFYSSLIWEKKGAAPLPFKLCLQQENLLNSKIEHQIAIIQLYARFVGILWYWQSTSASICPSYNCGSCWEWWRIYLNNFQTTQNIQAITPDIVLLDENSREIHVVEFSAPTESNVFMKGQKK